MSKIKLIFYTIYTLTIVTVVVMSLNLIETIQFFQSIGWFRYFSDLPNIGRNLLLFMCSLMAIELLIQRTRIFDFKKMNQKAS